MLIRREVLGYDPIGAADPSQGWFGQSWEEIPVRVVEDAHDALTVYIEPGAPFTFPEGDWPAPDGLHPWHGRTGWTGHGCLMVQRPGEHHAVWHFWKGPDREFAGWYINLQTAFRRNGSILDTQDLEVDLVVAPDGSWEMKDWDALDDRVAEGRFTPALADWIRALATDLGERLDRGDHWWDHSLASWRPSR